tara:strand:- start:429 stop:566 length:138 start_codon:yes stop_codon:yes gene_type:complete
MEQKSFGRNPSAGFKSSTIGSKRIITIVSFTPVKSLEQKKLEAEA